MKRIEHKIIDGIEKKRCGKCIVFKGLCNFYKNSRLWDGLDNKCKQCDKENKAGYNREYYKKKGRDDYLNSKKPIQKRDCNYCKKSFIPKFRNDEKYCCKECSSNHWRMVNKDYLKFRSFLYYRENKERLAELAYKWRNLNEYGGNKTRSLERDKYKCVECGSKKQLVTHHVDCDRGNNQVENLATLCRACHARVHHSRDYNFNFKPYI